MHPFEHLGPPPYRVIDCTERRGPIRTEMPGGITIEVGAPGQPMGTCDHCGTGIAYCFAVQAADGRQFVVGCDCVRKAYRDAGLPPDDVTRRVELELRKIRKAQRDKAASSAREFVRDTLDDPHACAALSATPHPHDWGRVRGLSFLDYARWVADNCGDSGMRKLASLVRNATT